MKNTTVTNSKQYLISNSSDAWNSLNYIKEEQNEIDTLAYDADFFSQEEDEDMQCVFFTFN